MICKNQTGKDYSGSIQYLRFKVPYVDIYKTDDSERCHITYLEKYKLEEKLKMYPECEYPKFFI